MPWELVDPPPRKRRRASSVPQGADVALHFSGLLSALLGSEDPLAAGSRWLRDYTTAPPHFIPRVHLLDLLLGHGTEGSEGGGLSSIYLCSLPLRLQVFLLLLLSQERRQFPPGSIETFAGKAASLLPEESWTRALLVDLLAELGVDTSCYARGSSIPHLSQQLAGATGSLTAATAEPAPPTQGRGPPDGTADASAAGDDPLAVEIREALQAVPDGPQAESFPGTLLAKLELLASRSAAEPNLIRGLKLSELSDEVFFILSDKAMCADASTLRAEAWAAEAIAPRLLALRGSASASLLATLRLAGERHQVAVVGHGLAEVAAWPGLTAGQCEVLLRTAKEALSPRSRGLLLLSAVRPVADGKDSGPQGSEQRVALLQGLLAQKPRLLLEDPAPRLLVHYFSREASGPLSTSVKFGKCITTAVGTCGAELLPHKSTLLRAAEATKSFLTKSLTAKITNLK